MHGDRAPSAVTMHHELRNHCTTLCDLGAQGGRDTHIARAIAISPEVLICDEATCALDVSIQKQILDLLKRLIKERNLTYLFICHDLAVVQDLSDAILVMRGGEVMEYIESDDLVDGSTHPYTKLLIDSCFDVYGDQNYDPSEALLDCSL